MPLTETCCGSALSCGRGGGGGMTCYLCGEEGHISRDCPTATSSGGGGDAGGGGLRLPAPRARKKIIGRVIACGTPGCSRGAYHDGLCSTERAGKRTRSTTNYNGRKRSRAGPQQ